MEFALLAGHPLFWGMKMEETQRAVELLEGRETAYPAEKLVLHAGEPLPRFGILLEGKLRIWKEDYRGNGTLLAQVEPVDLFGEAFACSGRKLTVSVQTALPSRVLWLDSRRLFFPELSLLAQNLLRILAEKNVFLTGRIEHLSKRTLREKLLSYLSEQALQAGSLDFCIPFNRQELADFLAADRSALSAVLSGLQKEGILSYRKNHFSLRSNHPQSFLEESASLDG